MVRTSLFHYLHCCIGPSVYQQGTAGWHEWHVSLPPRQGEQPRQKEWHTGNLCLHVRRGRTEHVAWTIGFPLGLTEANVGRDLNKNWEVRGKGNAVV